MKSKYSLLTLFLSLSFFCRSQSVTPYVVASSGDFFANSSGQIQWTLGEMMVETYQNTNNIISQGFHQPFNSTTGIAAISVNPAISAYPNPANQSVFISMKNPPAKYTISLLDVTGKLLQSEEITTAEKLHELSIGNYSNGMYFVKIQSEYINYNQSIRIIKTN